MTRQETTRTKAMTALFCAVVVAHKCRRRLPELLKILPVSPEIKSMALRSLQFAEP